MERDALAEFVADATGVERDAPGGQADATGVDPAIAGGQIGAAGGHAGAVPGGEASMGVELMGRSQLKRFAALNDAIGHRAPEAKAFSKHIAEVGLRRAVKDRDAPFAGPGPPSEGDR